VVVHANFSTNASYQQTQTTQVLVPRFDPTIGELRAVEGRMDLDYAGQLVGESSRTSSILGSWYLSYFGGGPATSTGLYPGAPNGTGINTPGTHLFGPRDGSSCNGSGADWAAFSASSSASAQRWNTDPLILAVWKGPPVMMNFNLQVNSTLNPFPWQGCWSRDQSVTGRWTITYYYR